MQILYAHDIRKEDIRRVADGLIPEEIATEGKAKEFAFKLIDSVIAHQKTIDGYIAKHADNWELDRMAIIDKCLMRVAIAEILFLDDVPPKVSINEAIEISKRYSTDKSGKFINGILDATLNELKASGKLQKTGRGLIDIPAKHPKELPTLPESPTPTAPTQKPASPTKTPKKSSSTSKPQAADKKKAQPYRPK
jgi:N utilization substance protein B